MERRRKKRAKTGLCLSTKRYSRRKRIANFVPKKANESGNKLRECESMVPIIMDKETTEDLPTLTSEVRHCLKVVKKEELQEETKMIEEDAQPPSSTEEQFETVIVKQEIIEEFEIKLEPLEDEIMSMERNCLGGEETVKVAEGSDCRGYSSTSSSQEEYHRKFGCQDQNPEETKEPERMTITPNFVAFVENVCDKCDCNVCECSVKKSLEQRFVSLKRHDFVQKNCLYSCTRCKYQTAQYHLLKRHVMKHNKVKSYSCTQCNFKVSCKKSLDQHLNCHLKEKSLSFNECGIKTSLSNLVENRESHQEKAFYSCSDCEYVTVYEDNFKRHKKIHQKKKGCYSCAECEFKTATIKAMNIHKTQHCESRAFACDQCEFKAVKISHVKTHKKTHNQKQEKQSLFCEFCDYETVFKSRLTRHKRTHIVEQTKHAEPYLCDECGLVVKHANTLKVHKMTHSKEKPFACSYCEFRTVRKTELRRHVRTHTGEKPYGCEQCDYRTAHKKGIRKHKRIHSKEKPYSCIQCEYKTTEKHNLKTHIRTHSGEKPFSCDQCEYKASHNCSLKAHIRKVHS